MPGSSSRVSELFRQLGDLVASTPVERIPRSRSSIPAKSVPRQSLALIFWLQRLAAGPQDLLCVCDSLGPRRVNTDLPQNLSSFLTDVDHCSTNIEINLSNNIKFDANSMVQPPASFQRLIGSVVNVVRDTIYGAGGMALGSLNPRPYCTVKTPDRYSDEEGSPVFYLIEHGPSGLHHLWGIGNGDVGEVVAVVDGWKRQILQAFYDGTASPRDVNERGENILFKILSIVRILTSKTTKGNPECSLLVSLLTSTPGDETLTRLSVRIRGRNSVLHI